MLDKITMKETYVQALMEEMERNPEVVILEADLMGATGTKPVFQKYPDRAVNVGVAEANMVAVAAGMASFGKIPICASFSSFLSRRDFDQICISVCYSKLNVKLVGTDPGVSVEKNGGTHTSFEDVALMRVLPGMTLIEPCDNVQMKKAVPAMINHPSPVYMRMYRKAPHIIYDEDYEFVLGKADQLRDGSDVTIIASGMMVWEALQAEEALREKGISVRVINMHTIKPLDVECILKAAAETRGIVTAENCNYIGGLGSAVAEVLAENDGNVPFKRVGIRDHFGDVGTEQFLKKRFHISAEDIEEAVMNVLARADSK